MGDHNASRMIELHANPDWQAGWKEALISGQQQRQHSDGWIPLETLRALEKKAGIPKEISDRWDETIRRFLG